MSLADPLPAATFADQLRLTDGGFVWRSFQKRSRSGGGKTFYADRAPGIWVSSPTTMPMPHADAEGLMALINSRAGGIKTILLYNHRLPYPSSDPDGSIFGAAAPVISTITDQLHIAFTGFPNNYVIPLGTFFGAVYASGAKYYLGQFVEPKTAGGTGAVSSVEIWPPLPDDIETGQVVTVKKPVAKMHIVPGTAMPSVVQGAFTSITFSAEQDAA